MATIAVGDIHGNLPALDDLLGQLRTEVDQGDVVVFLGDYIDRGSDSKGCVNAILDFKQDVSADVVCLCGNHEDWFLRTLHDYRRHSWLIGMEGFDTIRSYSDNAAHALREAASAAGLELYVSRSALPYDVFFDVLPKAHLSFFECLLPYCETPDCICVHAGLNPRVPQIQDQERKTLIWGDRGFPADYAGSQIIVYGHWNNADVDSAGWPRPKIVGRTIGLDTIAHGVLSAMRLPDKRLFQSDQYQACRRYP